MGTFTMCHAAFDALKAAGDSVIINISATLHYGATWYQVGRASVGAISAAGCCSGGWRQ